MPIRSNSINGSRTPSPPQLQQQLQLQLQQSSQRRKYIITFAFVAACLLLVFRSPDDGTTGIMTADNSRKNSMSTAYTHQHAKHKKKIRQISILGERNSGTRWTYDHISECFNYSIFVEKNLTRYKHWFQYDNPKKYPHDTLVLAQFRNPYDWLKAMEHVPHHSPAHLRLAPNATLDGKSAQNEWKLFLEKPWTTKRVGLDLAMNGDEMCQDDFLYKDAISCAIEPLPHTAYNYTLRYSEHQPFYEMQNDGSGKPYANIMELRTDKIRNFLSVKNYDGVADVWVLQYEYLVKMGTQHLLDRIEEYTGLTPKCTAKPSQVRKPKPSRLYTRDNAKYIRDHLNWTVEEWIGYAPELQREQKPNPWRFRSRT